MKIDNLRLDYVFSYWIFLSYVLYYFRINPYNPKHALIVALVVNCLQIFIRKMSPIRLFLFVFLVIVLKLIPIYTLRKTAVSQDDDLFHIGMFIVYIIWLVLNGVDPCNFQYPTPLIDLIINK